MAIKTINLALAALVLAGGAAPASATKVAQIYSGIIKSGMDYGGVFGVANASLTGLAYTATCTIDDAVPGTTYYDNNDSGYGFSSVGNGIGGFFSANPVRAVMRINDIDFVLSHSSYGSVGQYSYYSFSGTANAIGAVVQGDYPIPGFIGQVTTYMENGISNRFGNPVSPADFRTPFQYAVRPGDVSTGLFGVFGSVLLPDILGGGPPITQYFTSATAVLQPNAVRTVLIAEGGGGSEMAASIINGRFGGVPMSGAVPEPASWAMLIAGFGLVGAMLRQRRVVGRAPVG